MLQRYAMALAMMAAPVLAQNPVVGLWQSSEPNKTVHIRTYEEGGKLMGKVEKLVKNGVEDKTGVCTKCSGEHKDKLLSTLQIIWDMQKDGNKWTGGKILDPDNGKVFKCVIEPLDGGKKLSVKGSFAFISKTQTWTRLE
jgi:uncharacterized protein (DUF2147 family)